MPEHVNHMVMLLEDNCLLILCDLVDELQVKFGIEVAPQTVHNALCWSRSSTARVVSPSDATESGRRSAQRQQDGFFVRLRRQQEEQEQAQGLQDRFVGNSCPEGWRGLDLYKHAMENAFEKNLLDGISKGDETEDTAWNDVKKGEFKKKQAEIKILIQGSLSMRLAKQVMSMSTSAEMWQELVTIYEGKSNPAMTAQKVYRLQRELHRTNLRGKDDVRGHLYKLFDIKTQLEDLGAPVKALQMVDRMLRSLPTAPCYNELRRKVLFSSNMAKYTPDAVRELILTAELRSTDWDNNAFGNKQGNTAHQKQSSAKKGTKKQSSGGDPNKKSGKTSSGGCFLCGGTDHYKRDCPELEEKPSGRKAQAKYARFGEKFTEQEAQGTYEFDHAQKRDVVVGVVVKRVAKDYDPSRWYFDTGSNAHITACKEYFTSMQGMENRDWNPTISGFADGVGAKAEGFGTIMLAAMIDEQIVFVLVEDVL
ncbi:unnamed protein product [Phytophthora fragariaefolia]|uniref:Unnamed protein product n=1 Tax=Phytophthora fragariaefolia TaxID=1490495 RepID=A0A9W6XPR2_9STRA|nr:unnamed protein product [Phytophthora fragariaefolia]